MSLALMEAALETGAVRCELQTWAHPGDAIGDGMKSPEGPGGVARTGGAAVDIVHKRLKRQASISKPVSAELAGWLQGLALMVLGMVLSVLSGWNKPE